MNSFQCSFIIPVYNSEPYIARCLDSVMQLRDLNWEIVLVDDGSTDASYAICDEYARSDKRIRLLHQSNKGVSSARNLALDVILGDYVVFLDSDDWIDNEYLTYCIQEMYRTDADIFQSPTERVRGITPRSEKETQYDGFLSSAADYINSGDYFACIGGNIIKSNIIRENDIRFRNDIKLAEDQVFIMDCLRNSSTVYRSSMTFYKYYVNENSATSTSKSNHMIDSCNALIEYKRTYSEFKGQIDYTLLYFFWFIIENDDVPIRKLVSLIKTANLSDNYRFSKIEILFVRLSSTIPVFSVFLVKFYNFLKAW